MHPPPPLPVNLALLLLALSGVEQGDRQAEANGRGADVVGQSGRRKMFMCKMTCRRKILKKDSGEGIRMKHDTEVLFLWRRR